MLKKKSNIYEDGLKTSTSFHKSLLPHHRLILILKLNSLLAKRQAFNDSFQSRFNVYFIAKKINIILHLHVLILIRIFQQRRHML